jgi:hypothetical protein
MYKLAWSLDETPRHHLEQHIRTLQSTLPIDGPAALEFTTRPADVPTWISPRKLAMDALPFILDNSCSTPIFTRLTTVLELLTSGNQALELIAVHNVSKEYCFLLKEHVMALQFDRDHRKVAMSTLGERGWRKEIVLSAWMASLIESGRFARWLLIVRRRDTS